MRCSRCDRELPMGTGEYFPAFDALTGQLRCDSCTRAERHVRRRKLSLPKEN